MAVFLPSAANVLCYNQPVEHLNFNTNQNSAPAAAEGDPWAKMAGVFKDASLFDE